MLWEALTIKPELMFFRHHQENHTTVAARHMYLKIQLIQ